MHPEISLVLLLVLSGVGQGIFIFLVLLDMLFQLSGGIPPEIVYTAGLSSLLFAGIGMAASMFHLGNPQRGWKAIIKWKESWLSKEAVFMGLFTGSVVLYLISFYLSIPTTIRMLLGFTGMLSALGLYISSAMLYAKIRFIREWSNAFTVLNFILLGLISGGAVALAILQLFDVIFPLFNYLIILLGITALISKLLAYKFNASIYAPIRTKHAIAINDPNIRLMSTGTSYEHYNTEEYYYPISKNKMNLQQTFVLSTSFIFPIILWLFINANPNLNINVLLSVIAAISVISGLIAERRLFFIQGNHIQNLYYERFRYSKAKNPVLSRRKKEYLF